MQKIKFKTCNVCARPHTQIIKLGFASCNLAYLGLCRDGGGADAEVGRGLRGAVGVPGVGVEELGGVGVEGAERRGPRAAGVRAWAASAAGRCACAAEGCQSARARPRAARVRVRAARAAGRCARAASMAGRCARAASATERGWRGARSAWWHWRAEERARRCVGAWPEVGGAAAGGAWGRG